jgi:hypothetical protein
MKISPERLEAGRKAWQARLGALPRPLVVFLIGGPTSPFVYNAEMEARLRARMARVLATGGTPYIVGSRRTPKGFLDRVIAGLPEGVQRFDWTQPDDQNPYTGLLALADRFVVTGDSISMLVEVARLGKALEILPLPFGPLGKLDDARRRAAAWMFQARRNTGLAERLRLALARGLYHMRMLQQTRHFPRFHQILIDRGLATWMGESQDARMGDRPALSATDADVARILARIDPLLSGR